MSTVWPSATKANVTLNLQVLMLWPDLSNLSGSKIIQNIRCTVESRSNGFLRTNIYCRQNSARGGSGGVQLYLLSLEILHTNDKTEQILDASWRLLPSRNQHEGTNEQFRTFSIWQDVQIHTKLRYRMVQSLGCRGGYRAAN